jgi:protein TonB
VVVALLLFLLMHTLITGGKQITRSDADGQVVDFIRVREEEMVNLKRRTPPKKPPPPKRPPPPPKMTIANQDKPPPTPLNIETPDIELSSAAGGGPFLGTWSAGDPAAEGDVIPIVRIDPQWPREALIEGKEGWVLVEFTITEDGSVKDVQVLEAEPRRLFNRNAIRAILKWKFKPRIIDGAPVQRQATQRIDFKLDQ